MNNETCFLWGNWRKASDVRRKEGKRCFFADCFAFVSCVLKCQAIKSFIKLYCIADTSVTYFSSLAFVSVLNSYILVWCEQEYNNCYSELCEELNDLFCVFLEVFPTFLFLPGSCHDSPLLNSLSQSESSCLCCLACFLLDPKSIEITVHLSLQGYLDIVLSSEQHCCDYNCLVATFFP